MKPRCIAVQLDHAAVALTLSDPQQLQLVLRGLECVVQALPQEQPLIELLSEGKASVV
jgi:hypothetical protein